MAHENAMRELSSVAHIVSAVESPTSKERPDPSSKSTRFLGEEALR